VDFIAAWYLKDLSICDDLIQHFENNVNRTTPGHVNGITDRSKKDFQELFFEEKTSLTERYLGEISLICDEYKKLFPECDQTSSWRIIENIKMKRYVPPNQGYHIWHFERSDVPSLDRHLVFLTYLNDVNDGGETEFLYQKVKIKPRKGLTIMWPADWTHTHRSLTSNTETKYIIGGWYNFER
jgi:prolyl 4-hydroxylase